MTLRIVVWIVRAVTSFVFALKEILLSLVTYWMLETVTFRFSVLALAHSGDSPVFLLSYQGDKSEPLGNPDGSTPFRSAWGHVLY